MRKWLAPVVAAVVLGLVGWSQVPRDRTCRFAPWWDVDWPVRQLIEVRGIDHLSATRVPLAIRLGPEHDWFWAVARPEGRDVRAVDCQGEQVPLEFERYDSQAREAILWVELPWIGPDADNRFLLYVGGPSGEEPSPRMWADDYGLVLHMTPGVDRGELRDSTPHAQRVHLADREAPTWIEGVRGQAIELTDRFLEVQLSTPWILGSGDWTLEAWLDVPTPGRVLPRWAVWMSPDPATIFSMYLHPNRALVMELASGGTVADHSFQAFAPREGKWSHSALVRSGDAVTVYLNGLKEMTWLPAGLTIADLGSSLRVGAGASGQADLRIDELRVSLGVARSEEWLQASRLAVAGAYAFGWLEHREE